MNDSKIIVNLYQSGNSLSSISREVGISVFRIKNILRKNSTYVSRKAARDFDDLVRSLYDQGITNQADISKKINRDYKAVCVSMQRQGLINEYKKRLNVNEDFFEIIDTEEKAYILGLMYSDGCVYKNTMIIGVTDKEIVENVKRIMRYEGPIELYKKDEKCKLLYKLRIKRKKIFDDLISKGCIPKKSLVLKFPDTDIVPDHLIKHFIRGIFDGDGCICNFERGKGYTTKGWIVTITGTKEIIEGIQKCIGLYGHIQQRNNKNTWTLNLQRRPEMMKFLNFIYKDHTVCLTRKERLYKKFLSEYPDLATN